MKTKTILVAAVALFLFTANPDQAHAAQAIQINDTTVLFTIDFNVTAGGGAYEIPIVASSRVTYNDRVDIVGYNLTTSDAETPSIIDVTGLVLSEATASGTRYQIAEDESATFTLFILATFAESITGDAMATISKLPYWINGRRTTVHQNQLDDLQTATLTVE